MKYQILFSVKKKKKNIINYSSAEYANRAVKVNIFTRLHVRLA